VKTWGLRIGRLNPGSNRDVAYTVFDATNGAFSSAVHVVVGRGNGRFFRRSNGTAIVYQFAIAPSGGTATAPRDLQLVDLDDDGLRDIVTANETSNNISVLINMSDRIGS